MTDQALISLQGIGKTYPGSDIPAVADLDLNVTEGGILVLVGPSGCGKSTTLRLINRMIEPTTGHIFFEGEDVTTANPDLLRRRIGYVIQQIGLFPHMTIAENVSTVPKLLKWDTARTAKRVDELLDMVGMDPSIYRGRYPKELSGGQAQRVGVARALGADPDVMLMDEPFGAIDPITRDRLQNEFLRLQGELKKTIVFVTHDIDEAIKMGDQIAILRDQSKVAQLDTPERILANPADAFVADFLGSGSTLKGLTLVRVKDIEPTPYPVVDMSAGRAEAARVLQDSGERWLLVLDNAKHPVRWLTAQDIDRADQSFADAGQAVRTTVQSSYTLRDALELMLHSAAGCIAVVDNKNEFAGVVKLETLARQIQDMQVAARLAIPEDAG